MMNIEDTTNPYPGLRSFEYTENHLFFGREGKAQKVAEKFLQSHFVAVVGTSGSGKSSLVRAGLLPLLHGGVLAEYGSDWRISIMRPGETPIRNLARALVHPADFYASESEKIKEDETEIGIVAASLRRSGVGLLDFYNNPTNKIEENENLLIVVDQFEEIFRFKEKTRLEVSEEAIAFVKLLTEATRKSDNRIYVVITMRSDFLGNCDEFRELPEAINRGQYLIPQMTRKQLRESIESPALVMDAQVTPALINRLLNDLEDDKYQSRLIDESNFVEESNQADDDTAKNKTTTSLEHRFLRDHLPVLQHALMRTWSVWKKDNAPKKPIDIEHYEKIGGMAYALSLHADEAFSELSEKQQEIAEKMFKCLTETDLETREIRRPAKVGEICAVTGFSENELIDVIEVFRRAGRTFVMPPPTVELTEDTKIDISHESLIRNWKTLSRWVKEEAVDAAKYHSLAEDALEFETFKQKNEGILKREEYKRQKKGFLWDGVPLKDMGDWWKTFQPNAAWASRYQILTEAEKEELAELNRTVPDEVAAKRREFNEIHFQETEEFLKDSKNNEVIEQAEEKKFLQMKARQRYFKWMITALVTCLLLLFSAVALAFIVSRQNSELKATQDVVEIRNKELENERRKINEQFVNLSKANEEIIFTNKLLEEQKKELEEQKKELEKTQDELKKYTEKLKGETKKTDEQRRIAESNAKKAESLQKQAETETTKAVDAGKKFESKVETLNYNWQGLISAENEDYEEAAKNFSDMIDRYNFKCASRSPECETENKIGKWWGFHNLAYNYARQGNFEDAESNFKKALDTLRKDEISEHNQLLPAYPVSIMNISYNPQQILVDDGTQKGSSVLNDITKGKIITLRKLAQLYRQFAADKELVGKAVCQVSANQKIEECLNIQARKTYEQLNDLSLKDPKSLKDPVKADIKIKLADIYTEFKENDKAEEFYRSALDIYRKPQLRQNTRLIFQIQTKIAKLLLAKNELTKTDEWIRENIIYAKNTLQVDNLYSDKLPGFYDDWADVYSSRVKELRSEYQRSILERRKTVGEDIKKFLDTITYFYSSSQKPKIENPEQQKIWDEVSPSLESVDKINQRFTVLNQIGQAIRNLNAGQYSEEKLFERYYYLADAYSRDEFFFPDQRRENTLEVLGDGKRELKERIQKDFAKYGLQLFSATFSTARLLELRLCDSDAANYYQDFGRLFDEEQNKKLLNNLSWSETREYSDFLRTAGFYFFRHNDFDAALGVLIRSDKLLEEFERNFKETNAVDKGSRPLKREEIVYFRLLWARYTGVTLEYQKSDKAISFYEQYFRLAENSLQSAKSANNDDIYDELNTIKAYYGLRLASLYLEKGMKTEALKFLNSDVQALLKKAAIYSYSWKEAFIFESYIRDLIRIGDSFPAETALYYTKAFTEFEEFQLYPIYENSIYYNRVIESAKFTKTFYNQYIAILEKIKGDDAALNKKYTEAIEKLKTAPDQSKDGEYCIKTSQSR